ncbi:hypothetical protein KL930_000548 [Ogataea haglerorum]|uniref:Protein kinase domain-containing protein n=2 Tax=Saccharomycotina TaxID=147537 RepID=A0AAN6I0E8_9ASCO|nr:uncharacterized protein KL911_000583 [Ogataea haglerorum]KAG7693536.1 hypothetical protein KL951_004557 [Ogataea haglerorum]KAG7701000.1 hypothetical protein KL915_000031 [Ogataea haglerorum]KAG7706095.1 hypothetical protein KL950_003671 [Ogataea haglerorum]KAG7708958.1 hypothetical protein KL914_001348 [Ogataea haglerorum]KAG7714138.1 hypothetical protein KL949_004993 [Ogataea haglerorum]
MSPTSKDKPSDEEIHHEESETLRSLSKFKLQIPSQGVLLSPRGTPVSSPHNTGTYTAEQMLKIQTDLNNGVPVEAIGKLDATPEQVPVKKTVKSSPDEQPQRTPLLKTPSFHYITNGTGPISSRSSRGSNNYQKLRTLFSNHSNGSSGLLSATVEGVRPHSSILRSNLNTKYSQQYQQQEMLYLNGINKFKNRYRVNDDYYNKSVDIEDDEDPSEVTVDEDPEALKIQDKFEEFQEDLSQDDSKEFKALKALSQQVGMTSNEWEKSSEYRLDSTVLLDILNQSDDIQLKHTDDNAAILERLEWQSLLQSVLTGDVLTGEKTKLIKPLNEVEGESYLRASYKEDLWIGIRSKLFGRTEEDQKRLVQYHRSLVDEILDEIMNFRLEMPEDIQNSPYITQVRFGFDKVNDLLNRYERCQELWRTQKEMENEKPLCGTPEFTSRLHALIAWTSITSAIERESDVLKKWVGNDDLDILRSPGPSSAGSELPEPESHDDQDHSDSESSSNRNKNGNIFKEDRSFVERIMKEKDIADLFNKRLFASCAHWTFKAKESYLEYQQYFEKLNLPSYVDSLLVLAMFPSKLMKELVNTRLSYAKKLKNPTMMMIDQVLEDFKLYITLALEIRSSFLEYCSPREGWISSLDYQDANFDNAILECVHHYLLLLNRKLLDSPKTSKSFRTFKEPEELEREWSFLQNLGFYIEGGSAEVATQFSILTSKLVARLHQYMQQQFQGPPYDGTPLDKHKMVRWYTSMMENFGQLKRKFFRFHAILNFHFENSILYNLNGARMKKFLDMLKESNHVLYHNAQLAEEGIYVFASESIASKPYEVSRILKSSHLGVDFSKIPKRHLEAAENYTYYAEPIYAEAEHFGENQNEFDESYDYVLVVYPAKAMMWDGIVLPLDLTSLPVGNLDKGKVLLISKGGSSSKVEHCANWFKECVGNTIGSAVGKRCSLPKVQRELQVISKQFFRMSCFVIDAVPSVRNQCRGIADTQELANTVFTYVRDAGRDFLRTFDNARKSVLILKLLQFAIEWLSFIVDDCIPTDPKTFRWCVSALEFAMDITTGFNILTLDSEKFYRLKDKVAGCMSLLISHFDIMGARTKEMQKKRMLNYQSISEKDLFTLDDESLSSLREHIMYQIGRLEEERRLLQVEQQSVGRVLDDTDTDNQFLTYLASSFSSVSIRWQKGKFLGGGTFGSVYASINLDTGGALAVKEIRFQDRQSIKSIVPAIKGEMTVLEMLSHPNIVQFFGVEVHRDRVYIFMEYCSGGSLASLLEYGRIEDESVIQLYTLQMLEGLAYLHQFGIVHRDIKPENILLDHMGVIKFVDFGSAKVIAMAAHGNTSTTTGGSSGSGGNGGNGSGSGTATLNSILHSGRKTQALTGTPMYMSPETIRGETIGKFGAIDIWSLGCCLLEMATGRRPWANLDNEFAVMYHIAAGHLPQFPSNDQLSIQGQHFLAKCLDIDPTKRLTAVELLQDPWIQAIRNEAFSDSSNSSTTELSGEHTPV